jgi:DUF2997 family protein
MDRETIEIVIGNDGTVKLGIHGIKGTKCNDIANKIAKNLGEIKSRKYSNEYFENDNTVSNFQKLT